ncbi:MAG TPA: energy transducer TonB [Steroidobacteraceae bacterium]
MTAYVHDTQFFTRRTIVLFAIVALHVFIAWALATGLARRAVELVAPPLQTEIVQEVQKKDEPPPPPPPQLERPPVEVPPPDVQINVPVETTTAIQDVTNKPVVKAPPPAPKPVNRTPGGMGAHFPNSDDYYPPASRRMGEQGAATVHVCVGVNGKLTEEPTVSQSSGSSRLDEGAVKLAKAGSGRYKPGTEDGKPINSCFQFRIKFELH